MEYIQPFILGQNIEEEVEVERPVAYLKPSAPKKGRLELVVVHGNPVYLSRGRIEEPREGTTTGAPKSVNFDLGANESTPGVMSIEGEIGTLTVWCNEDWAIGYIRFVECDCP